MATKDCRSPGGGPVFSRMDCAKAAVETFLRQRKARNAAARISPQAETARYLLVATGLNSERPRVMVGWGRDQASFERALKTLAPNPPRASRDETGQPPAAAAAAPPPYPPYVPLNYALAKGFDLLGMYRVQNGVETLGQGRRPWRLDQAWVVLLTDAEGHRGPDAKVQLPSSGRTNGAAPFHWDHRLFTLVIHPATSAAAPKQGSGGSGGSPLLDHAVPVSLSRMSDATGGRCWRADSMAGMVAAMEAANRDIEAGGVVVRFKCDLGGEGPTAAIAPDSSDAIAYLGVAPVGSWPSAHAAAMAGAGRGFFSASGAPPLPPQTPGAAAGNPCRAAGSGMGAWAIPENFWCDRHSNALPPRPVHPTLLYANTAPPPPAHLAGGGGGGSGGGGAAGVTAVQAEEMTRLLTKDQLQRDPCAWLDTYIGLGMPVDWYEVSFKEGRHVGRRHPLLGEVIRSAPQPRRLAVFLRNAGRTQTRGECMGVLVSLSQTDEENKQMEEENKQTEAAAAANGSGSGGPKANQERGLRCRLALLPYGFASLAKLMQQAQESRPGPAEHAIRAGFSKLVRAIPPYYHPALTAAAQPLRMQKGGFSLLRALQEAAGGRRSSAHGGGGDGGGGGAGGLSKLVREYLLGRKKKAEAEASQAHRTRRRVDLCFAQRAGVAFEEAVLERRKQQQQQQLPSPSPLPSPPAGTSASASSPSPSSSVRSVPQLLLPPPPAVPLPGFLRLMDDSGCASSANSSNTSSTSSSGGGGGGSSSNASSSLSAASLASVMFDGVGRPRDHIGLQLRDLPTLPPSALLPTFEALRRRLLGGRGRVYERCRLQTIDGDPAVYAYPEFSNPSSASSTPCSSAASSAASVLLAKADAHGSGGSSTVKDAKGKHGRAPSMETPLEALAGLQPRTVPIAAMGNYLPLLRRRQVLRSCGDVLQEHREWGGPAMSCDLAGAALAGCDAEPMMALHALDMTRGGIGHGSGNSGESEGSEGSDGRAASGGAAINGIVRVFRDEADEVAMLAADTPRHDPLAALGTALAEEYHPSSPLSPPHAYDDDVVAPPHHAPPFSPKDSSGSTGVGGAGDGGATSRGKKRAFPSSDCTSSSSSSSSSSLSSSSSAAATRFSGSTGERHRPILRLPDAGAHRFRRRKVSDASIEGSGNAVFSEASPLISSTKPAGSKKRARSPSPNLQEQQQQQQQQGGAKEKEEKQMQQKQQKRPSTPVASSSSDTHTDKDANPFSHLQLPLGWIVAWSSSNKRHYFFDTTKNKTSWVAPEGTTDPSRPATPTSVALPAPGSGFSASVSAASVTAGVATAGTTERPEAPENDDGKALKERASGAS